MAQVKEAGGYLRAVEVTLVAIGQGRRYVHDLHRAIPCGRCGDRPTVGAETDCEYRFFELLTAQAANVVLAAAAHFRSARVTEVRIVRPDDDLGASAAKSQ